MMMNMTSDFLSRFQKSAFTIQESAQRSVGKVAVSFMLQVDSDGNATVTVVSEKGEAVDPDYRLYQGETFNVLAIMRSTLNVSP